MASSSNKLHPWFEIFQPRPSAKYQVFIFPAAGSPGSYYRQWGRDFPDFEFSLVVYPGRTSRIRDELLTDVKDYVKGLDQGLVPYIYKPCFFIGHSIGCLISFALAKHMIDTKNKGNLIRLMIQMGRGPVHLDDADKSLADMTDDEIREDMKRMADPATKYVFDVPSYLELVLPILRADGQAGKAVLPATPLSIPIIAYVGEKEDNLKESLMERWSELTTAKAFFRVRVFPGHHNFQAECGPQVLACLKEDFDKILSITQMY